MSIISQEQAQQYKHNAKEAARIFGIKPKDAEYQFFILRVEHLQRHAFYDGALKGMDIMSKYDTAKKITTGR